MFKPTLPLSSGQPDPGILRTLQILFRICFVLVSIVCFFVLLGWFVPPLRQHLPYRWDLMKVDTIIGLLLSVASLSLSQPKRSARSLQISHILAVLVILIAIAGLLQSFTGYPVGLALLLNHLPVLAGMGKMSPHTASALFLLGFVMLFLRVRKNTFSIAVDACALFLVFLIVTFISGYFYGAMQLFGASMHNRMSPQTMACFAALTFIAFSRRAEYGVFEILLGNGIGSRTARLASPFALALPFLLASTRNASGGILQPQYATALSTSTTSLLAFVLILVLSRRIERLEQKVRALSLRDELTSLYNRRGFYLFAEQSQGLARRSGKPFTILFLDVDGLKLVNDEFGHDAGSALLCEMADFLSTSFRETDVISRIGGDEFAVACSASSVEIARAVNRLEEAISIANASHAHAYTLSFSFGHVTSNGTEALAIEALLKQADDIMYATKRNKKIRVTPAPMTI